MDSRYTDPNVAQVWSPENKLSLWQRTELAMIEARVNLGRLVMTVFTLICAKLRAIPIDLAWWKSRDKEIGHDLQAAVDERCQHLDPEEQALYHHDMTSYDTEEPAFSEMLMQSIAILTPLMVRLFSVLAVQAVKYRFTIMLGRTHGQEAELQTHGKRCLTWYRDLHDCWDIIQNLLFVLKRSKLSGAIGNYGGVDPELERAALKLMHLEPYYGATQIMPRAPYAILAAALCTLVQIINKVALDIRLGARSGCPIYQEPFGKKQKGSSRMPQKKNTIKTEQLAGMARMAKGYADMIMDNIQTWEERAIEQSCVERVAWPDLFHVTCHSAKTIAAVLEGLQVFPDNMLREIVNSRGCYAAGQAKEFIRDKLAQSGFTADECYRMVQLAAFCAHEPDKKSLELRKNPSQTFASADEVFWEYLEAPPADRLSISTILTKGLLRVSDELDVTEDDVNRFNLALYELFTNMAMLGEFQNLFTPSYLLRNEHVLFEQILGEAPVNA